MSDFSTEMRRFIKLLEADATDLEGAIDAPVDNNTQGTAPATSGDEQKMDPKKVQLINQFARALNPDNAQKVKAALVAIDQGTKPNPEQLHAMLEIVVNIFKVCEVKPDMLQQIKTAMGQIGQAAKQQPQGQQQPA